MDMIFKCKVDKNAAEKFKLALMLNKEEPGEVIEKFMLQYVSKIVPYNFSESEKAMDIEIKELEFSHTILKAFFQVEREVGYVPLKMLEERCSDEVNYTETYVQNFTQQFEKLLDTEAKPNGKVFDVVDGKVIIWDCVKATLMSYKDYFER